MEGLLKHFKELKERYQFVLANINGPSLKEL
jgi:hypothetical protein